MTYEPGTADIMTTGDVPFPGEPLPPPTLDEVKIRLFDRLTHGEGITIRTYLSAGMAPRYCLVTDGGREIMINEADARVLNCERARERERLFRDLIHDDD